MDRVSQPCGPLTTHDMAGAGGPFNQWDRLIRARLRRGDRSGAAHLIAARARVNAASPEQVWVPTPSQRAIFGLLATMPA